MSIEVVNKLFQPLTLARTTGVGLHLQPRARVVIPAAEVSAEMRRLAARGDIALTELPPLMINKAAAKATTTEKEG